MSDEPTVLDVLADRLHLAAAMKEANSSVPMVQAITALWDVDSRLPDLPVARLRQALDLLERVEREGR